MTIARVPSMGAWPDELGHGERQAGADAGRQRAERDEVGGLLRLGGLRAGRADEQAASVDGVQLDGVERPVRSGACAAGPLAPRGPAPPPWPTRLE